jgi:hypothetical protein
VSAPERLRAPQQDGAILAVPGLDQVGVLVAENRRRLARGPSLLGRSWQELQQQARRSAVAAACAYLQAAGEPLPPHDPTSLLLAGHQPEIVHPGVWVKHFALAGLARRHGATPVNLVVDNDTVKTTALHVPVVSCPLPPIREARPHRLAVPFDRWTSEAPYEERPVLDEGLFASFPERARQRWCFTPLLEEFWPEVLRQAQRTPLLGERFAAARRTFERRWGCHNLEVPGSRLCQTEPFAWFACHLLANLQPFHALYNATVHAYRASHGIRSRSHPVPDLATDGDWREAPFWAWRPGQARRGRLFIRRRETALELRAGAEAWSSLPLAGDWQGTVRAWLDLEGRGFKVRSRALTNTLYARLFLADLFIHGIGGGKYDELTDALIRDFYGLEPPAFLVLSATLLLPLPHYPATAEECRRLAWQVRDLHWNPQRHMERMGDRNGHARQLAKEKEALLAKPGTTRRQRHEQFRRLRQLTEELRGYLADQERDLDGRWRQCAEEVKANALLRRRDYAICLYPEALLRPFCMQFL